VSDNSDYIMDVWACEEYNVTVTTYSRRDDNSGNVIDDVQEPITTLETSTIITTTYPSFNGSYGKESSASQSIVTSPRAFDAPTPVTLVRRDKNSLTLNTLVNEARNLCGIKDFIFTCVNGSFEQKDSSLTPEITLGGLSPYTQYSCTASVCNNYSNCSVESGATLHRTSEGRKLIIKITFVSTNIYLFYFIAPDPPRVFIRNETITTTSFSINWDRPVSTNGNLTKYEIQIKFIKFTYFNPIYCESFEGNITNSIVDFRTLSYNFTIALPAAEYSIQVQAKNEEVVGEYSAPVFVTTLPGELNVIIIVITLTLYFE
jgi:Fibronectin type III domain